MQKDYKDLGSVAPLSQSLSWKQQLESMTLELLEPVGHSQQSEECFVSGEASDLLWVAHTNQAHVPFLSTTSVMGARANVLGAAGWCRWTVWPCPQNTWICIWTGLVMPEELAWILALNRVACPGVIRRFKGTGSLIFLVGGRHLKRLFSGHCLTEEVMEQKLWGTHTSRNAYFVKNSLGKSETMALYSTSQNHQSLRTGRIRFPELTYNTQNVHLSIES